MICLWSVAQLVVDNLRLGLGLLTTVPLCFIYRHTA